MKALLVLLALSGCNGPSPAQRRAQFEEDDSCRDTSTLLATTSGSPNQATCPNKRHRMHVQVATTASHEEVGALVFCQCERGDAGNAGQ